MATFKVIANINNGDETTASANLFYKIYDSGVLMVTTGTSVTDANVSLVGSVVTITNIERDDDTSYSITITQVDESNNESLISNVINITSGGGNSMYAAGMYASGMYA